MQECEKDFIRKIIDEKYSKRLKSGTYNVLTSIFGQSFPGIWEVTVNGSSITGLSKWNCCPGPRKDAIKGSINGNTVAITRNCTGQGEKGPCKQVYTGEIGNSGISGEFIHNGKVKGTWSLSF
jgi:hypothetical protein